MVQPNISNSSKEQLTFFYFIFTDVMEVLSIYLLLVKFLSFQIFIIFAVYHFFIFIIPGFFQLEYLNFKFTIQILLLT